jgi:hypothetical protein
MRIALPLLITLVLAAGNPAAAAPARNNSESIPPNCTMDPFTGKLTCHIWPTCTIDPFTGKMNCPPPKVRRDQSGISVAT